MSDNQYDVVIIGGGPGGYVAAIRAAQLGLNVALVEKDRLGGTCLHRGCIPSKAILRSAEIYATLKEKDKFGIEAENIGFNYLKIIERKQNIVDQLTSGIEHLMKKNKIQVYEGIGRIMGPSIFSPLAGTISVEKNNGESEMLPTKHVIVATGSRPRLLPGIQADGENILTSDEALAMKSLPKSMIIIGAGVIGMEWTSLLNDLGVDVTVIEYENRILPLEDEEISREMTRVMKKRKVNINTGTKVLPEKIKITENGVEVIAIKGDKEILYTAEKVLISVGRIPNVENIGLENTDIKLDKGHIKVNQKMQTAESHIYAIGDVIGELQLAHVASHEGIIAVESIAGNDPHGINYKDVPRNTYSRPEVASIGLTEEQAKEQGHRIKTGKFSFKAIGKALIFGEADGFVKIIIDKDSKDILGIHMIGPHVTELISEASLAKILDATAWEIGETIHPHPTLSEAIGEAALAVDGLAIHM